MDDWFSYLVGLPPGPVYAVLAALLLVEGTGLPLVPFEPAFLAAGILVRQGRMSAAGVLALGTLAHLAGNLAGYLAGRRLGNRIIHVHGARLGVTPERWETIMAWLHRWGGPLTVISRFVGIMRTPAILGAGAAGMNPWAYAGWSLLGGFLWCGAWLWGSILIGAPLLDYLSELGAAGLALLAVLLGGIFAAHLRRRN